MIEYHMPFSVNGCAFSVVSNHELTFDEVAVIFEWSLQVSQKAHFRQVADTHRMVGKRIKAYILNINLESNGLDLQRARYNYLVYLKTQICEYMVWLLKSCQFIGREL